MRSSLQLPLISIEVEREEIPVQNLSPRWVPDEKWRYVDKQGHGHFYEGEELPTLEWVVTGTQWVGDEYGGDEYEVGEWRCRLCGEVIKPAERAEYGPPSIPGLTTFYVTINNETFPLTPEEYAHSVESWADALRQERATRSDS